MRRIRKGIWKNGRDLHGHSTSLTELFAWCKAQTALRSTQQQHWKLNMKQSWAAQSWHVNWHTALFQNRTLNPSECHTLAAMGGHHSSANQKCSEIHMPMWVIWRMDTGNIAAQGFPSLLQTCAGHAVPCTVDGQAPEPNEVSGKNTAYGRF